MWVPWQWTPESSRRRRFREKQRASRSFRRFKRRLSLHASDLQVCFDASCDGVGRTVEPLIVNMRRIGFLGLLLLAANANATPSQNATRTPSSSPSVDSFAPSPRGVFGAWLVAGPFRAQKSIDTIPEGVDERALAPVVGTSLGGDRVLGDTKPNEKLPPARWQVISTNEFALDVKGALEAKTPDLLAYAAGTLHVEEPGRHYVLLGVDDGVRVFVDGKVVFTRDESRPIREDDDILPLDLTRGDHAIVLKLHQRDGAWAFRVRVTGANLEPSRGAYLKLDGVTADDARTLAGKMSSASIDRTLDVASDPIRYRPRVTVRFPGGAPRGVPIPVTSKLTSPGHEEAIFDVNAGGAAVTANGAPDFVVGLPALAPWTGTFTLETTVSGRAIRSTFPSRTATEQALLHVERAISKTPADSPWLAEGSLDSVKYLSRRLADFVTRGDTDDSAQADDARDLERLAASLDRKEDPYAERTGPMRRALRSPADGEPSEFGLYVPPSFRPGAQRKFPLVVGLHGMNGFSMSMIRWLFGGDDPKRDQLWEDRHMGPLPPLDAIVVTPYGHGNTMYRELGEDDVMRTVAWAMRNYPIDPARVTITGPSMGGIGSAAVPLHAPHVFAAAAPLCGYHSYFVRRDVAGRPIRPWERFLAEERSNAFWAENGEHLPLFIVHGTKDLPEENSGVLIDRYDALHFSVKHEHPELAHNVWQTTYEDLKGLKWLLGRRLDLHPKHVRFRTTRTRWAASAWVSVDELAGEASWAEVDARVRDNKHVTVTTRGVAELSLKRDAVLFDSAEALTIAIDGKSVAFDASEAIALHRDERGSWEKGAASHAAVVKRGTTTGPIRDVFHEPILFVYGANDDEARANEEVARAFSRIRPGVKVAYPVMSDVEFFATNEPLANERALFLVGRKNRVLTALEEKGALPIHVSDGAVTVGAQRFTGKELGAAFVWPNPVKQDRYVVVLAGADLPGTLRGMSLPELLPDFVVWDESVAPARGQILLGGGALRAGGFFRKDWSLPAVIDDPLAKTRRPSAKSEHDATPYLP